MILYLGNKLSRYGYTPTSVETLGEKISEFGFDVIRKSSRLNKLWRLADMILAIIKYRKVRPIVLIDTYSSSAFWFSVFSGATCTLFNLKYIPILRGGDLTKRIQKAKRISDFLFRRSFMNIAVSGYMYDVFSKIGYPVEMIHNYIELEKYPFKHRKVIQPNILWVRAFHRVYNPLLALAVLTKVRVKYPDAALCMVGPDKDGSLKECMKLSEKHNLNVIYTGKLEKADWIRLSDKYDIFINTTNVDNAPVSVMEAMALGMPVVTTNAGGIPFLFENNSEGIMVETGNVDLMASAVLKLLDSHELTSAISYAARSKAEQWGWNIIGPRWKSVVDVALDR